MCAAVFLIAAMCLSFYIYSTGINVANLESCSHFKFVFVELSTHSIVQATPDKIQIKFINDAGTKILQFSFFMLRKANSCLLYLRVYMYKQAEN